MSTDDSPAARADTVTRAKLACVLAGAVWGLFWFPLRWLAEAGFEGPWSAVAFSAAQLLCLAPIVAWRARRLRAGGLPLLLTGLAAGVSMAAYALAVVYTDVIRAMLLFYLTPLWSTLLARVVFGEPITGRRWVAIGLAFGGLVAILGTDGGLPWPRNAGDWLGLASGLVWAVATVRLRLDRRNGAVDITAAFCFWSLATCLAATLLPGTPAAPAWPVVAGEMAWLIPLVAAIGIPGALAALWGPKHVDPGLVGILFMSEIVVGTVTAAIWAGEPFGLAELAGVVLIAAAGLFEAATGLWRRRRPAMIEIKAGRR